MTLFDNPSDAPATGEIFDAGQFFAPAPFDLFDTLMGQYDSQRRRLNAMAAAVSVEACAGALHYFVKANAPEQKYTLPTTVGELFNLDNAVAYLDADFWDRALKMTDVLDIMPQARRTEWYEQISQPLGNAKARRHSSEKVIERIPEFTVENVRASLESLIAMRGQFFGERVDGIFCALSRSHVTNLPEGFSKRMIIKGAVDEFGMVGHRTAGTINDLRCIIAKFMGRDEPGYNASSEVISAVRRRNGEWQEIDGGALRMRVYNGVGTAHLEVHPDMAWKLNAVLHSLHPNAIPSQFREPPKKSRKVTAAPLFSKPLPFAVLNMLATMKPGVEPMGDEWRRQFRNIPNTRRFEYGNEETSAAGKQAADVLRAIGGVVEQGAGRLTHWRFDYEPGEVLDSIVCSGMIPDHVSHQFYPTPDSVADAAMELAQVGARDGMSWLEPSAGIGNLADRMPKGSTRCIEISKLHATILRAKGHEVEEGDFLATRAAPHADRILMNPPFSGGRWQAHVEHAAAMLRPAGRLVAIVPASAVSSFRLPGFDIAFSGTYANEFAGTGVSVVILSAERAA